MAMCPLLRKDCIQDECAWWYAADDKQYSSCVVSELPDLLNGIADDLENVNGTLDSVVDDTSDIRQQLYSGITVNT